MRYGSKVFDEMCSYDPLSIDQEKEMGASLVRHRLGIIEEVVDLYFSGHLFAEKGVGIKTNYSVIYSDFGEECARAFKNNPEVAEGAIRDYNERVCEIKYSDKVLEKSASLLWKKWSKHFGSLSLLLYGLLPIAEKAIALRSTVESDPSTKLLTLVPQEEYIQRINKLEKNIEGFLKNRELLILHNMRFVRKFLYKPEYYGLSDEVIIQEGMDGLERATHTYDPKKGFFISYARGFIRNYLSRQKASISLIRIPIHAYAKLGKLFLLEKELTDELGYNPSIETLAAESGINESIVRGLLNSNKQVSLDCELTDAGSTLYDFLPSKKESTTLDDLIKQEAFEKVVLEIKKLTDREQEILVRRKGLFGHDVHTLEEVGKIYDITRERVRQIECGAIRKIRTQLKRKGIKNVI